MRISPVLVLGLPTLATLMACGGGGTGGAGGGDPLPPPPPFGFAVGPTTTLTPSSWNVPPFALRDLELADYDHDGKADLGYVVEGLVLNIYGVEANLGLGDGSFGAVQPGQQYVSGEYPMLSTGDVLGVGKQGFALGNLASLAVSTGVFTSRVSTLGVRTVGAVTSEVGGTAYVPAFIKGLAVGDWNGDGIDDVAIADGQNGQTVKWFSIGESGLGQAVPTALPQGQTAFGIAGGDWEGDGDDDVMAILFGTGYITYVGPLAGTVVPFGPNRLLLEPVTGDFDGDGKVDVAGVVVESGIGLRLWLLRGRGDGTFEDLLVTIPVGVVFDTVDVSHVHAGDFDGDGRDDLAMLIPNADRTCIFLGTATGTFSLFADPDLQGGGSDTLGVGDVDGDGDLDLVVGDRTTLQVRTLINER